MLAHVHWPSALCGAAIVIALLAGGAWVADVMHRRRIERERARGRA